MNRFFKKNLVLLIVTGITLIVVVALIYLVVIRHGEMTKYLAETQQLIKDIQALNKQKPSPAAENLLKIKKDTQGYQLMLRELQQRFDFPFSEALDKFTRELGVETADFKKHFHEYWKANNRGGITGDQVFRMFRASLDASDEQWNKAILEFTYEARKQTLESVDANNVEEILMEALGVPRDMSGSVVKCTTFMNNFRDNLLKHIKERKVNISPDAASFSFNLTELPDVSQMSAIVKSWNIIGDLVRRIADAKVDDLISFSKGNIKGRREGDYIFYRFTVGLYGKLEAIRHFQRTLYDAYQQNRIYVVRYIKLEKSVDGVQRLLDTEEVEDKADATTRQHSGIRSRLRNPLQRTQQPTTPEEVKPDTREENLPFYQRKGYGQPIIGASKRCNAVFEIEYVAYVGDELN